MPTLGESVMCAASASGCIGTITASTAVYRVQVELVGNVSGDSVSITNCYGSFCDEVSIDYSVAQIGTESNSVLFSGGYIEDSGTSPAIYRIDPCDALDGVITLTATFTHTGDSPPPPIDDPIEPERGGVDGGEVPPDNTPTDEDGGEPSPETTPTEEDGDEAPSVPTPTEEDDSEVPQGITPTGTDWRPDTLPIPTQSDDTYSSWISIAPVLPLMPTPPPAPMPVALPPEPLPAESEIIAKTATVRDDDSSRGKRLGTLEKGDKLTIPGFVGDYAAVEWEGDIGYVRARDISVAFGAPMDVTITKDGWTYSRTLEKRQYRLATLEEGQTLQVTGRFGRWYWITGEDGAVTWIPAAGAKIDEEWTKEAER